jgi:hypothetical protein
LKICFRDGPLLSQRRVALLLVLRQLQACFRQFQGCLSLGQCELCLTFIQFHQCIASLHDRSPFHRRFENLSRRIGGDHRVVPADELPCHAQETRNRTLGNRRRASFHGSDHLFCWLSCCRRRLRLPVASHQQECQRDEWQ